MNIRRPGPTHASPARLADLPPVPAGVGLASDRARQRMVDALRAAGIRDEGVLAAMGSVPRHQFIEPGLASRAYEDVALPIGHGQTISKPSTVARMIEILAAPTMQRWFTAGFLKGSQDKVAPIREQFLQTTVDGFCGCAAAMRDMDQRESVKDIKAPTLVIVGADDQGTTPAEAGVIVNCVPDARGIILKASHIVNVEAADVFTKEVLEFLG